jgi:mandelate racemase
MPPKHIAARLKEFRIQIGEENRIMDDAGHKTTTAKIVGLRTRPVLVPMSAPHRTASGVIVESPLVLIDVITDAGAEGHGILFTYTRAALKPTSELVQNLEPLVRGQELAPGAVYDALTRRFRLLGCEGLVAMAIAGIDMAAWDALARLHDVSLVSLLGGQFTSIPAYGAVGFEGVDGSAKTAEQWAKRGFSAIKLKIGYGTWREDAAVVQAVRSSVPDGMRIMVDYNQSLTPTEAVERIRRLEPFDLTWIEEPVDAHDLRGHAFVAREVNTPIQCGENWWGAREFGTAVAEHASDYVMADVMKIGGVTGWMRAASIASAHGVKMSNHLWPEISSQLLSVTATAHFLEYADWWNPVLSRPLEIQNGSTVFDGVIGSGIEWDESTVSRFVP